MTDFSHALSLVIVGLVLTGLSMVMGWHVWSSRKKAVVQVSLAVVVRKRDQPGWFRGVLLFFTLCAAVLLGAGVRCLAAGMTGG